MIKTDLIIKNAITHYKAFEWTSNSGEGTTKFQAVFGFEHNSHDKGYPYMWINDTDAAHDTFTNMTLEGDVNLEFAVCVKWDIVDLEQLDISGLENLSEYEKQAYQKEEAMIRLREAWNAFKADIVKISTFDTIIGNKTSWLPSISFDSDDIDELNLFRRICRINLKEYLNRY